MFDSLIIYGMSVSLTFLFVSAKLRNAKIRLSNIKLDEIVQVMRGKSKWIKH